MDRVVRQILGDPTDKDVDHGKNLSAVLLSDEPSSFAETEASPDSGKWKEAIDAELAAHAKNKTWYVVDPPPGVNKITAKWVFKKKLSPTGQVDRYKARLVARGFTQVKGIDYTEVFAPVVKMDSVRLLFSLSAQLDLVYYQFDVATAFLNGIIEEDLYLEPPEGLEVPPNKILKLNRSLYGLKQSPRCWNARLREIVEKFQMKQTISDPCVYVKEGSELLILALYVDDGLVFAKNRSTIEEFIKILKEHFDVKEVTSNCFLGVEILRSADGSIFLHQRSYIKRMLERYEMQDCNSSKTPVVFNHPLNKPEILEQPVIECDNYAAAIGSLLYCAMSTRPDICYALSVLSKHTKAPRKAHWEAVKRVFRYLKGTMDHGLHYMKVSKPQILCYSDADWGGDHENRKSTSGMITSYSSEPISFKAQQQSTVALSTTEAEYISACVAVKDLI